MTHLTPSQTIMSFIQPPRLPIEVISKIVEDVADFDESDEATATLYQISLVSRALWDLAQRHLFTDIVLKSDPRGRMAAFNLLSGPRGKRRGRYARCLYLFECIFWITAPGSAELIRLIADTAPNIQVLHIGYNYGYLDWMSLHHPLQMALVTIMFGVKKAIIEGLRGFPLHFFRVFRSIETLDLSHVALGPLPAPNSWVSIPAPINTGGDPCPTPSPTFLAVHTGLSKAADWPNAMNAHKFDIMFHTLLILKTSNMINFSNLTTLYLTSMKPNLANGLYGHILSACAKTLQTLRLGVYSSDYDRNARLGVDLSVEVPESDIIDLSALTSLKCLYLVATARYPITLLHRLARTIKLPDTHLTDLKLLVDDNLEGADWTFSAVSGIIMDDPKSWDRLDQLINVLLRAHDDTFVDFMMAPSDTEMVPGRLGGFMSRMFPVASKNSRFRLLGLQFRSFAVNELFSSSVYAEETLEELTDDIVSLSEEPEDKA
ncbi:hypothetical protein AX15_000745 [Amanita polypyramis BW_CC]|nr:hypothetical protein AX15_000745 [Amanita polypyramis BW_CC]